MKQFPYKLVFVTVLDFEGCFDAQHCSSLKYPVVDVLVKMMLTESYRYVGWKATN